MLELALAEAEVRSLLPRWDVGGFVGLPGEGGGSANPAVVVDTERGRFFLKRRNPRYSAPEMLRHDHALMEHLALKGLPAPLAVPTGEGTRWATVGEAVYELYPYMAGHPHDPKDEGQIREAGRVLAEFHRATADFGPPHGKEWPRYHDPAKTIEGLEWARDLLTGQPSPTPAGRDPTEARAEVERLLDLAYELQRDFPDETYWAQPVVLVHGDWHPANVKCAGGRICGVFDLDWSTRQPRLVDLADGVIYFAGRRPGSLDASDIRTLTRAFTLSDERLRLFLQGYTSAGSVAESELLMLPRFMLARWLYSRVDPMRRKIAPEEAIDYLLEEVWCPVSEIQEFHRRHKLFTTEFRAGADRGVV
jgi:Ser/Thr protein kinase RdoA (MazF antagonist)